MTSKHVRGEGEREAEESRSICFAPIHMHPYAYMCVNGKPQCFPSLLVNAARLSHMQQKQHVNALRRGNKRERETGEEEGERLSLPS